MPGEFLDAQIDMAALRARTVENVDNSYTRGERRFPIFLGRRADFDEHMNEIRSEFAGKSELLFFHSCLVVAIRRNLDVGVTVPLFFRMWREQGEFLRENLSLRWLISTCDTLVDHGETATQRALAMTSVFLVNTIKIQETERFLFGINDLELDIKRAPNGFIFDGLTYFSVSDGDMIRNMLRRARSLETVDALAGPILIEIVQRLQSAPTVFQRMSALKEKAQREPQLYPKIASRRTKKADKESSGR